MALTHARFTHVPEVGDTRRYYQHIVRFSASFAFAVDVAMLTLGGYLKKKENLSARLGDVLSAMYLASMVLKHHENQGRPAEDLPIVEWACRNQLYKAQEQLHDFLRNFPNRFLAGVYARADLPRRPRLFGAERPARQALGRRGAQCHRSARPALQVRVSHARARQPARHCLHEALVMSQTAEPIEKRIRVEGVKTGKVTALDPPGQIAQARGSASSPTPRRRQLREYDRKVMELISVDDFESHELAAGAQPAAEARASAGDRPPRRLRTSERPTAPVLVRQLPVPAARSGATAGGARGRRRCPPWSAPTAAPRLRANTAPPAANGTNRTSTTIAHFAGEAFESITHADSRLWRTLGYLLARPGRLTREFFEGRRARYLPPFRLYLVISLLFFLIAGSPKISQASMIAARADADDIADLKKAANALEQRAPNVPPATAHAADGEARAGGGARRSRARGHDAGRRIARSAADLAVTATRIRASASEFKATSPTADRNTPADIRVGATARVGGPRRVRARASRTTCRAPCSCSCRCWRWCMKLLYWRPKRYYVEHLLFLVHNHAFVFLAIIIFSLLMRIPFLGRSGPARVRIWLYIVWYIFRAMRNVYAQRRGLTFAKYMAIGFAYLSPPHCSCSR